MKLTKDQRNDIYRAVEAGGLEPSEFKFRESKESYYLTAALTHVASGSSIEITSSSASSSSPYSRFSVECKIKDPGNPTRKEELALEPWKTVLNMVTTCVKTIKSTRNEPDLWNELKQSRAITSALEKADIGADLFTAGELAEIARRFEEIKSQVRAIPELTKGQIKGIEQRLDDLKGAGERVGKRDWLVMLYGNAFGMLINDAVSGHVVETILNAALRGVAHLFGVGAPPLILPPGA
jgi:hypothetical protein